MEDIQTSPNIMEEIKMKLTEEFHHMLIENFELKY